TNDQGVLGEDLPGELPVDPHLSFEGELSLELAPLAEQRVHVTTANDHVLLLALQHRHRAPRSMSWRGSPGRRSSGERRRGLLLRRGFSAAAAREYAPGPRTRRSRSPACPFRRGPEVAPSSPVVAAGPPPRPWRRCSRWACVRLRRS